MANAKFLQANLAAQLLEVRAEHLLLRAHPFRLADARPQRAQIVQIVVGPLPVEGDVGQREPAFDVGRRGSLSAGVVEPELIAHQRATSGNGGRQQQRLAGRPGHGVLRRGCHCTSFYARPLVRPRSRHGRRNAAPAAALVSATGRR